MFDRGTPAPTPANAGGADKNKAVGFLNFYLPNKAGDGKRKLGFIPLRGSNAQEKSVADWLKEDPTRVEIILRQLVIEFNAAEVSEGAGFALVDDRVKADDQIPG